MSRDEDLRRIEEALDAAREVLAPLCRGPLKVDRKTDGDPVTEADRAVDATLHRFLLREGEGWLSEETADDPGRLGCSRVWVVDPVDGTREFVEGIPEWCVSIGLVEDGEPVAGGVMNPATGERFVGAVGRGLRLDGHPVRVRTGPEDLTGAVVLASRSEVKRGEWKRFEGESFRSVPMGSVAYKLARVAAGLADATFTLVPKHEWDVAGGVALVLAGGGEVRTLEGERPAFNRRVPLLSGLLASRAGLLGALLALRERQ